MIRFLSNDNEQLPKLKSDMIHSERLEFTGEILRSSWPAAVAIFEEIIKYLPNLCELSMPSYTWPQLYRLFLKSNQKTKQKIIELSKIDLSWLKIDRTMGQRQDEVDSTNFFNNILCPKIYSLSMWVKVGGITPNLNLMPKLKKIDLKFCWDSDTGLSPPPTNWNGLPSACYLPNLEEFHLQGGYYKTKEVLDIISNSPKLHTLNLRVFRGACDIQPVLSSGLFPVLHTLILDFARRRVKLQYCIDRETQECEWPQLPKLNILTACCKKKPVKVKRLRKKKILNKNLN